MTVNELKPLNDDEQEELLKAPAYIVMLAANSSGEDNELGKRIGLDFNALDTFTSGENLHFYFQLAKSKLQGDLLSLKFKFPDGKVNRDRTLREKLAQLKPLIARLPEPFGTELANSLNLFAKHIGSSRNQQFDFNLDE